MSRKLLVACLVMTAMTAAAGVAFHNARADDEKVVKKAAAKPESAKDLRDFMRRKLEASNQILEGLALDDMTLVREGAGVLAEMSSAEKWRVSQNVMYRQFSEEFNRTAQKLVQAAESKNIDRAALRWMDTTMACIECHRFVRNELVVQSTSEKRP